MKRLSKFFLTILLLAIASASWAACPEGQRQTYKGCEAIEEETTEAQPEVKEVTSEKLELGGFVSEEINIGVVESDAVERGLRGKEIGYRLGWVETEKERVEEEYVERFCVEAEVVYTPRG